MEKKRRRIFRMGVWTLLLSVMLLLGSGSLGGLLAEGAEPVRGGTLRVGWLPQSRTFDPHFSVQWPERFVLYTIYNTLVGLDSEFRVVPELARSWEISDEGKTITFRLQPGVTFHDGTAFNAEVVKWNIERVLDPNVGSPQRSQLEPAIQSIATPDDHTAVFHLKQPWAPLLAALAERPGFMVSPTAAQKYGKDFGRNPVGTGPFKFVEWVPDDHLTVERFAHYWEPGKPYLDKIIYQVVPDPTVRTTMVRTGEVDIATDVDAKDVPVLQKVPNITVSELKPPARWTALQWHVNDPPFDNKALRQAIAYGIDREELKQVFLLGYGEVAKGPVVPGVWWYNPALKGFSYDPEMAKKKLAEAGYAQGFTHKFVVSNTPQWIRQAEILREQLKKIGVTLEFEMVNPADSYALVVKGQTNWTHTNWTQRADPNGLLYILFHSKGFANTTRYSNPEVDRLLEEAARIYDPEKRLPLYHQAEQMIVEDAPYVFLNYTAEFAVMNKKVQNWKWVPDLVPRFRELWIEK